MKKANNAEFIRNKIHNTYYSEVYEKYLFQKDVLGRGIKYFEKSVEKFWDKETPERVLEIGGGSGEHLPFLRYTPSCSYTSVDIRKKTSNTYTQDLDVNLASKIEFVMGDAQDLPFSDLQFDRVFSTCLLHHVDDVLAVLLEARRVTSHGGEIAFVMPTDPGMLNQIIKRMISYRKLRKMTKIRPELFYALEHKNHVGSIIEILKFVYSEDQLNFHYRPFRFKSWNLNLLVVVKIVKS